MTKQTKTYAVRMAKATPEDFETFYEIYGHVNRLEELIGTPLDYWNDTDRRRLAVMGAHHDRNPGAISRVVGCCSTLMSEKNALIDQSQDVLDFHPRLKMAFRLLDLVEGESPKAFDYLKRALIGEQAIKSTHLCHQCDDPEEPDENCELCGGEGDYEEMHVIDWTTQKETLSLAFTKLLEVASRVEN
ncbi:hypothetical protein [Vibrio harveyi]|uniref:hypothetical protein n=1 Tax=Vibrio harveyi TaxID=669 RepID=UPI002380A956|nr:hypothetical protein [Vibrio harveyi]